MKLKKLYMGNASGQVPAEDQAETLRDRQKLSAVAEIKHGKMLIIVGFIVSVSGILAYCLAGFTADFGQELSAAGKVGLALIAAGTVAWFIGAVKYFHGAVEADLPDELFF